MHSVEVYNVSPVTRVWLYLKDITRSIGRLVTKKYKRHREQVSHEYDLGSWFKLRQSRSWEKYQQIDDFLAGSDITMRYAKVDGRISAIRSNDYYRYRIGALQAAISSLSRDSGGQLVELGSGFGFNLFSLSLDPSWNHLEGYDISQNGLEAATAIARHFNIDSRMQFLPLDLTKADDPNYSRIGNKVVFTCFCIEQVPYEVEPVIRNILAQGPRRVIHIESSTERLSLYRLSDLANWLYVRSVDYQTSLIPVLEKLERNGEIRIVASRRLEWAPTIHNDGFMIAWEPAGHVIATPVNTR